MKKKIGFFVPEVKNCGPINLVWNLISHLNLDLFDIMLISVRKGDEKNYSDLITSRCQLGFMSLEGSLDLKIALSSIENDLDIIHSHGFYPDKYVSQMDAKKVKKISTIHSLLIQDYPKAYGLIKGTMGALLHQYYLNTGNFNKIVGCSKTVYDYLNKFINHGNSISYIRNGIDQNFFKPLSEKEKKDLKFQLGFLDETLFVFSGRITRLKKVPELINRFKFLNMPNSKLIILGEGDELNRCKKLINQNIILLGYVEDPKQYYQISDFILSMSSTEGYPMSILEALSCGCYAFLSDIPSHREFIENNIDGADFIENLSIEKLDRTNKIDLYNLSAQRMVDEYTNLYLDLN